MSHEKILIVEDEENERSGLAELVSSWGFRVETARDGAEGLDKATQWSPSIVITDMKMPRMGGIELLGHLSEQAATIAVIMLDSKAIAATTAPVRGARGILSRRPVNARSSGIRIRPKTRPATTTAPEIIRGSVPA